jgi:hypothetical protein
VCLSYLKWFERGIPFIFSGDVHQTFIQDHVDHQRNDNIVIEELVTSAITRIPRSQEPLYFQMAFWFQRNIDNLWFEGVRNRRNYSPNNNFGIMTGDQLQNYHN